MGHCVSTIRFYTTKTRNAVDPLFIYAAFSSMLLLGITWLGVRHPLMLIGAVLVLYLVTT